MKSARFTSSAAFSTSSVLNALRSQADVAADRAGEQKWILQNHAEAAAEIGEVHVFDIDAVDPHCAFLHIIEAQEQGDDRGLARAGVADDGDGLPGFDGEGDIAENPVGNSVVWVRQCADSAPLRFGGTARVTVRVSVSIRASVSKSR